LGQLKLLNEIWRTRHVNQVDTNPRLEYLVLKTIADSNFEPWFDLFQSYSGSWSKNLICKAQTEPKLSLKDQGLDQLGLQDIKLQSVVHETETTVRTSPDSWAPRQHCIEYCELYLTRLGTQLAPDP
jgi:hypothetical protein